MQGALVAITPSSAVKAISDGHVGKASANRVRPDHEQGLVLRELSTQPYCGICVRSKNWLVNVFGFPQSLRVFTSACLVKTSNLAVPAVHPQEITKLVL